MVGASGAISGVLGAYLVRYPRNKVLVLIPFGFFTQMVRIPAMFVLGFWFISYNLLVQVEVLVRVVSHMGRILVDLYLEQL
jgi:membrane associated rhomboid family serine protease